LTIFHHLEQLTGHVGHGRITSRRPFDLARIGFGVGNELRNGLGGKGRIDHHYKRNAEEARDWHDVADEIEI
jgi:hypothetical protein